MLNKLSPSKISPKATSTAAAMQRRQSRQSAKATRDAAGAAATSPRSQSNAAANATIHAAGINGRGRSRLGSKAIHETADPDHDFQSQSIDAPKANRTAAGINGGRDQSTQPAQAIADSAGPDLRFSDPLILQIRMLWRRRQAWHRAEKSLTLQSKALCRSWVGIPPITTGTACAMLIGKIFGCEADNADHLEEGLEGMIGIMRLSALAFLGERSIKN
jgi:hypothetical protein